MCDYSLCGLPTRLAVEGEELVVHKYRTGSIGLASPVDLYVAKRQAARAREGNLWRRIVNFFEEDFGPRSETAVCIPPGAQLRFKNVPEDMQREWKIAEDESAFFMQTNADVNHYRDAVRFRTGPPRSAAEAARRDAHRGAVARQRRS